LAAGHGGIGFEKLEALEMPWFLWTVVREPVSRAVSAAYWYPTMAGLPSTRRQRLATVKKVEDGQFHYMKPYPNTTSVNDVQQLYHSIGTMDRFDESVVVLAMKLRIPLTDVLYITAKNTSSGAKSKGGHEVKPRPPFEEEPQDFQDYLTGDEFKSKNARDFELYEYANKTLSEEIKANDLEATVVEFKEVLKEVQEKCTPKDVNDAYIGDVMECYSRDEGCGYKCIDSYSIKLVGEGRLQCQWCK
jgi:hypothetical protein